MSRVCSGQQVSDLRAAHLPRLGAAAGAACTAVGARRAGAGQEPGSPGRHTPAS